MYCYLEQFLPLMSCNILPTKEKHNTVPVSTCIRAQKSVSDNFNTPNWNWSNLHNCTCQMEGFGNITRATPMSQCHGLISHLTVMSGGHPPDMPVPMFPACPYVLRYTEAPYMPPPCHSPQMGCRVHGVCERGWQTIVLCCVAHNAIPPAWTSTLRSPTYM